MRDIVTVSAAGISRRHLDDGDMTSRQRFIAIIALFGLFLDGYDLLILSGALLGIVPYFQLKPVQVGILGASAFFGMIVGSLVAGPLTDRFGRRPVFFADMLLFAITALLFVAVDSSGGLLMLRFLIGVAIGADMPTSLAIVTEFIPKHRRGRFLALGNGFWIGGAVVGGIVGVAVFSYVDPLVGWRWILVSGIVPSLILFFLRRDIPETPRWLFAQGREREGSEVSRGAGFVPDAAELPQANVGRGLHFGALFRNRSLLIALVTMSIFWAIINFIGSAILLYTPTVIKSLVTPSALTALQFGVVINALVVVANIIASLWVIDRVGRRPLAIVPSVIIAFSLIAVAFGSQNSFVVIAGFAIVTILNSGFVVGAYYTWGSELFPTSVRGRAIGISNAAGKFGSMLSVLQFPIFFAKSPMWSLLTLAGLVFFNVIMVAIFAPETKGASLDELEATSANA